MIHSRETTLAGNLELLGPTEAWARSDDQGSPRGAPRTLLPGKYRVKSMLQETEITETSPGDHNIGRFGEQFYGVEAGEDAFVRTNQGTFTPS